MESFHKEFYSSKKKAFYTFFMGRASGIVQHSAQLTPVRRRQSTTLMYHAAPRFARKNIEESGLRGDPDEWDEMVWVWDNLASARAYADSDEDIYVVNVTDFPLSLAATHQLKKAG